MNIIQIFEKFPTQESCIEHLEKARWNGEPFCPKCGSTNTNPLKKELRHHCNGCRKSFSVTVKTIFHNSKVPLQKWFLLLTLMMNAKKGLSACQAARDLNMRRPTVWSMMHRIRKAMVDDGALLTGIVEMDETYIGGKPRKENKPNKDDDDKGNPRGRGTKKIPVVGMVERGGNVKASQATKETLKAKDLNELIRKNIDADNAALITDEYRGYNGAANILPHFTINHQEAYADGLVHTNHIEGFWAIVKRGIVGQFHKVSAKYLSKYLDEFCYRYNARKLDANLVFDDALNRMLCIR